MTEYLVPAGFGMAELTEKRSRFIARVWCAESEEEALARLRQTREEHWDAKHNVYAYIIRDGATRYSDDGEPQGTSGLPVLEVFRAGEIFNVCCVVTRYFGGTLLGTGGLKRAYSQAAKLALDAAGVSVVRLWKALELRCGYGSFERIKAEIPACGGTIPDVKYGSEVSATALLPEDRCEEFIRRVLDLTGGAVVPEAIGERLRAVRIR